MSEFIDPVFAKTCRKRSILMTENERFGLVFVKIGSTDLGTGLLKRFINSVFFMYRPARPYSRANRFLGSLNVYKYGLWATYKFKNTGSRRGG